MEVQEYKYGNSYYEFVRLLSVRSMQRIGGIMPMELSQM